MNKYKILTAPSGNSYIVSNAYVDGMLYNKAVCYYHIKNTKVMANIGTLFPYISVTFKIRDILPEELNITAIKILGSKTA